MNNSNFSENFQDELLISVEAYIAVAVILFLIGIFGFSLNLCVIVFMCKEKQLWTPLNLILFNLVVSDFLVSILGNPWTFFSALNYRWMFGRTGCMMYGFIMSLLGITSITTLTVLAFERYLIIAHPFRNSTVNFRNAYLSIVLIWIYSLFLTIPPLFGWGEYVNEAADISCSINWEEKSHNSTTYIMYLFCFGLFIPLFVITYSYTNIIVKVKQTSFRTGKVTKSEKKIAYMIFIMIVAFIVAWSPYAVLALIIQFGDASFITPGVAVIPALLAKSSICYNPVIYIGLNAQFQQTWRQTCKSKAESSVENLEISRMETSLVGNKVRGISRGNNEQKQRVWQELHSEVTNI